MLFQPWPERFLPETNLEYVRNLVQVALEEEVRKFILVSFPHVEGETTPSSPATGRRIGEPNSIHARTRLEAERHLFSACKGSAMTPIALRPGMIYARGVLMIDAARELLARRLLPVWPHPTWTAPPHSMKRSCSSRPHLVFPDYHIYSSAIPAGLPGTIPTSSSPDQVWPADIHPLCCSLCRPCDG